MSLPKAISDAIWTSIMEATAWCGWTDHAREGLISDVQREVAHALSHLTTAAGEKLPEIGRHVAHPQSVWFETWWRPLFEKQAARIAVAEMSADNFRHNFMIQENTLASLERENAALRKAAPTSESEWRYDLEAQAEADRIRDERG